MDNDSEPNNKWSILNVARRQQSSSDLSKNMTKVYWPCDCDFDS